jgi:hypothetical protein
MSSSKNVVSLEQFPGRELFVPGGLLFVVCRYYALHRRRISGVLRQEAHRGGSGGWMGEIPPPAAVTFPVKAVFYCSSHPLVPKWTKSSAVMNAALPPNCPGAIFSQV